MDLNLLPSLNKSKIPTVFKELMVVSTTPAEYKANFLKELARKDCFHLLNNLPASILFS